LTPEGRLLVERLQQAGASHLGRVLAHLSATELRTIVAGLEVLCWAAWADAAAETAEEPRADQERAPAGSGPIGVELRPR
jgi:hypothetical protein